MMNRGLAICTLVCIIGIACVMTDEVSAGKNRLRGTAVVIDDYALEDMVTPEIVGSGDGAADGTYSAQGKPIVLDDQAMRFAELDTIDTAPQYVQPEFVDNDQQMRFSEVWAGEGEAGAGAGAAAATAAAMAAAAAASGGEASGKAAAAGGGGSDQKYPVGVKPVPSRKKIIYNYYPYESYQPAYRSGYFYDPWVHHPLGPVPMNANPRSPTSRYQIQPFYYQKGSPNFQPLLYGYPQSDAKYSQTGDNYPYYMPYGR